MRVTRRRPFERHQQRSCFRSLSSATTRADAFFDFDATAARRRHACENRQDAPARHPPGREWYTHTFAGLPAALCDRDDRDVTSENPSSSLTGDVPIPGVDACEGAADLVASDRRGDARVVLPRIFAATKRESGDSSNSTGWSRKNCT